MFDTLLAVSFLKLKARSARRKAAEAEKQVSQLQARLVTLGKSDRFAQQYNSDSDSDVLTDFDYNEDDRDNNFCDESSLSCRQFIFS